MSDSGWVFTGGVRSYALIISIVTEKTKIILFRLFVRREAFVHYKIPP